MKIRLFSTATLFRRLIAFLPGSAFLLTSATATAGFWLHTSPIGNAEHTLEGSAFPSTVLITSSITGSGVLIDSQWILTAAHVLDLPIENVFIENAADPFPVMDTIIRNPAYIGGLAIDPADIALIRLKRPVIGVAPAARFFGFDEEGQIASIVGYGAGGTGQNPYSSPAGIRRAGQNRIDI
jgi:Trypsin